MATKKPSMLDTMRKAMKTPTPEAIKREDRFATAAAVLETRPTGYSNNESTDSTAAATDVTPPAAEKPTNGNRTADRSAPVTANASAPAASATLDTSLSTKERVENSLGVARYAEVPIAQTVENPYNARYVYRPEKVAELRKSVRANGQLIPGLATYRNGQYLMIAGHYRRRALDAEGCETIKLMVYDGLTDQQLYLLSYIENTEQSEQTALDNARAWRKLLDDGIFKMDMDLAEAIGVSKATISKTLSLLELESPVLLVLEQDPAKFGVTVAYELVMLQRAGGAMVAADMATRVLEQGAGRSEIIKARERHASREEKPAKRQYENARTYRLWDTGSDRKLGSLKEWDDGRVLLDVVINDSAAKQRFIEEVRQRLSKMNAVDETVSPEKGSDSVPDATV